MAVLPFRRSHRTCHRGSRGVLCDLPSHILRDIGLDPWPERPRIPFFRLW